MKPTNLLLLLFLAIPCGLAVSAPIDMAKFSAPVRVACIGDSITQGSGTSSGFSYPNQLQRLLGKHWEVGNFGVCSCTVLRKGDFPYWNEGALMNAQKFQPDVVIILLGANDTKPQNWRYNGEFSKDYTDLVQIVRAWTNQPVVFVCRPTPAPGAGNYGINEAAIEKEIALIDRIASQLKLGVIDMHAALDKKPQLLPDRVHPDNDGAGEMAKAAFRGLTGKEPDVAVMSKDTKLETHAGAR